MKKFIYNGYEFKVGKLVKMNKIGMKELAEHCKFKIGIIEDIIGYSSTNAFVIKIKNTKWHYDPYWLEPIESRAGAVLYGTTDE